MAETCSERSAAICKGCGNAPADPNCDGFCEVCYKALQSEEMAEVFNYLSFSSERAEVEK